MPRQSKKERFEAAASRWLATHEACTASTNASIWRTWNDTATTSWVTTNQTIWTSWNTSASAVTIPIYAREAIVRPPPETAEQRAARYEREARAAREREELNRRLRAEREAADRRAEALLRAHLTPEQQRQLVEKDWFLIDTASGKKYRINRGRSANVDVLDENGKVVRSLCAHPRENVPDADTMLSQLLMLTHEEQDFLRMANVHPINHGFRRRPLAPEERVAI